MDDDGLAVWTRKSFTPRYLISLRLSSFKKGFQKNSVDILKYQNTRSVCKTPF